MHIEILEEAQEDILRATLFYESQRFGAGDYFLDAISADIESLHLFAGIHPIRYGYLVLFSKRFPYTVYYRMERDRIRVYAVLDERQNPKSIDKRLDSETTRDL